MVSKYKAYLNIQVKKNCKKKNWYENELLMHKDNISKQWNIIIKIICRKKMQKHFHIWIHHWWTKCSDTLKLSDLKLPELLRNPFPISPYFSTSYTFLSKFVNQKKFAIFVVQHLSEICMLLNSIVLSEGKNTIVSRAHLTTKKQKKIMRWLLKKLEHFRSWEFSLAIYGVKALHQYFDYSQIYSSYVILQLQLQLNCN